MCTQEPFLSACYGLQGLRNRDGVVRQLNRDGTQKQAPGNTILLVNFCLFCVVAGEEKLRQSGVPYTIVRPAGLTNGPGGQAALVAGGCRLGTADMGQLCTCTTAAGIIARCLCYRPQPQHIRMLYASR